MRLHEPVNDTERRSWCGPTALSCLTGLPMSRFMPDRHGRMSSREVRDHLEACGFRVEHWSARLEGRKSLGVLWSAIPHDRIGVAVLNTHFVAFHGKMVRCPKVNRAVWVCDHPDARRQVVRLYLVSR